MKTARALTLLLLALLLAGVVPAIAGARPGQAPTVPGFKEVATHVCACQGTVQAGSVRPAGYSLAAILAPTPVFDEQLGTTFTQSFTAMAFNVTAVEQSEATSGQGPAYLLNGLADTGFWYQVGFSWNWNPGANPGTGFDMNYEVFNPQQTSIFPSDGSGGLQNFSGSVNQGDSILLNLYLSSGQVMMVAHDWNTGASASESFSAEGATSFQGDSRSNADSNGYFTGLMTEWYHSQPFLSNEKGVVYKESGFAITSAWLWMDEYNASNRSGQSVFDAGTNGPLSFAATPSTLQEFASNGATEYMDSSEYLSGAMNTTAPSTVPLTLSYSVAGGGSGYSAPVLSYVSGGVHDNATLGTSPTTYNLDIGSAWNVKGTLGGSAAGERWQTGQQTGGTASASQTIALTYYHQYSITASYAVVGAAGASPLFTYTSFGTLVSTGTSTQPTPFWVDAGAAYALANPLRGSNSQERWTSQNTVGGTATSSASLTPTYYQQFLVGEQYSVVGGGSFSPPVVPYLASYSFGVPLSEMLTPQASSAWLDAGSQYGLTPSINASTSSSSGGTSLPAATERWVTNVTSGLVAQGLMIDARYQNQYLVTLQPSASAAGSLSTAGGWYNAGSQLRVTATANNGWKFEYWGSSTVSGSPIVASGGAVSMQVNAAVSDTAVFYPGLTISTGPAVSVSYSYPSWIASSVSVKGTIPAGTSAVVYVPESGVELTASPSSFLDSFAGWSGASTSSGVSVTLAISGPASIGARSAFNYLDIGIILGAAILLIALAVSLAGRSRGKTVGSPAA